MGMMEQMMADAQRKQQEAVRKQNQDWFAQNTSFGDWQLSPDGTTYLNTKTGERMQDEAFQKFIAKQREEQLAAEKEAKRIADLKAQGLNPDGSPIGPEYRSMVGDDGKLKKEYQLTLSRLDPSTLQGYNMIKELATATGPSKWAETANQQAALNLQDTIDAATQQGAAAQIAARNQLGMRGGYSSGARERLAMQGQRDLLGSRQSAYRQRSGNLLDIMKRDEEMKRNALNTFAQAEGNIASTNLNIGNEETKYNLGSVLKDFEGRNAWDMDKYKEALDKWSANKQAEATARSGGGGGK